TADKVAFSHQEHKLGDSPYWMRCFDLQSICYLKLMGNPASACTDVTDALNIVIHGVSSGHTAMCNWLSGKEERI
ncbi:hypothetical protein M9458_010532, partial [Cirrhinus mrigala]